MLEKFNAPVKFLSFVLLCYFPSSPSSGLSNILQLCQENPCSLLPLFTWLLTILTVFSLNHNISNKPILTHQTKLGIPAMCLNKILQILYPSTRLCILTVWLLSASPTTLWILWRQGGNSLIHILSLEPWR